MLTSVIVITPVLRNAGTIAFPATSIPVGVSAIKVAVDRTFATDPVLGISLDMELSLDGGASWIPGGGMRTVGGVFPQLKTPLESSFSGSLIRRVADGSIEPGFEPSNSKRMVRGTFVHDKSLTAQVTVTFDDVAVPSVISLPAVHHSVSFDGTSTAFRSANTATSVTTLAFTITSGANRAGMIGVSTRTGGLTAFNGSIGGTSDAAITGTDSGAAGTSRSLMRSVIAPPSGSQTATMNWTNAGDVTIGVLVCSGVDQTTPLNNGTNTTGTTSVSVAITSTNGDLTVDTASVAADFLSAPTQTQFYNETSVAYGAGSTGPGTGNTTHTWTASGSEVKGISGANFKQAATAGNLMWIKA